MASYEPARDEPRDKVTTPGGKVHIQDNDSKEESVIDSRQRLSGENLLLSVPTTPGDANCSSDVVINSSTLHTSTDFSDSTCVTETSSSQSAAERRENFDVTSHTPSTLMKDVNVDVIDVATRSSNDEKDEPEYIAGETAEKRRDEFRDGAEHNARNDVKDKANSEAIEEARDETKDEAKGDANETVRDYTKDIVRDKDKSKANEEVTDETKDTVRGETQGEAIEEAMDENKDLVRHETEGEANEEARDEAKDIVIEAKKDARDENKDTVRDEAKDETVEEARDGYKDVVRGRANSDAIEEATNETEDLYKDETKGDPSEEDRDDTKDIDSHEANDGACDKAKGGSRILTSDGSSDEVMDGTRGKVSEQACNEAEDATVIELKQNEDDDVIQIEEDIWCYIQKTKEWTTRIRRLKELSVEINESTSGGRMRLSVCGVDRSNVDQAKREVSSLIRECQDVVHTIEVPCNDNHVHSKVGRLLKSINKMPSYVSDAPEVLRITGTSEEIRSCLEKLETYGVRYELERKEESIDFPEQETPLVESAPLPLDNSYPESLSQQLPVPIEKHLWHFIQEKRKVDLLGIEEGFGVTISTKRTNDVATVAVCISTLSSGNVELLGFAEQALGRLIGELGSQVVVQCVIEGEMVAKMPPEFLNSLRENLANIDVIIEIIESRSDRNPGHRLLIIGPQKELVLSQQEIKRAFEKVMGANALQSSCDDPENQKFPGTGNPLGSNKSKSPEERVQSSQENASRGHTGPIKVTGRPSFPVHPSESKGIADFSGPHSTSGGASAPKSSIKPPNIVGHISSEQSVGSSVTRGATEKEKKVTFANGSHTSKPPPPAYNLLDIDKPDTEGDATNCQEPKGRCNLNGSRNATDPAITKAGLPSQCSTCQNVPEAQRGSGCNHVLCLACVRDYMTPAAVACPVCGNSGLPKVAPTQPIGGQMLVTYNSANRLPGFEKNSKGIIIITYAFKHGYQTDDCPSPGQAYLGLTKTAFLPLSPAGNELLDLLQKAFEARLTFRIVFSPSHPSGELVWNEILHKENIFGGPKEGGFPDPVYMERVRQDLLAKGIH